MGGNSFGTLFRITTFGESHGQCIGVTIDGCPSGLEIDLIKIQLELNRRKPAQSAIVSQRDEDNDFEIISGFFEGKTTGTPLTILIQNRNQKAGDYRHIQDQFRPSHADFTYQMKYGHRDYRGGGRSSARETACRVLAGAVAKQILANNGIGIQGYVSQVGHLRLGNSHSIDFEQIEKNVVRCPNEQLANEMEQLIRQVRKEGDTIGGQVSCQISGVPVGLGNPVFDRLDADLAKAMLSINATKGFAYGSGFAGMAMKGSEHNDEFFIEKENKTVKTKTNHSGGIQGGISNGMNINFHVAFKPVATIMQDQQSIDNNGNIVTVKGKGRHDPCVVPRAVAIVEAMAALVLLDHYLIYKAYQS